MSGGRVCFNEAAAIRRGNLRPTGIDRTAGGGFNEAAAIRRGNLRVDARDLVRHAGFNEAAAIRRGNLARRGGARAAVLASMRPRLFAAEIPTSPRESTVRKYASMRPRLFAAEIALGAMLQLEWSH